MLPADSSTTADGQADGRYYPAGAAVAVPRSSEDSGYSCLDVHYS